MRARLRWGAVAVGVVVTGVVYVTQAGPDTPYEACVDQLSEHREEAFTSPVTGDEIEAFCREFLP